MRYFWLGRHKTGITCNPESDRKRPEKFRLRPLDAKASMIGYDIMVPWSPPELNWPLRIFRIFSNLLGLSWPGTTPWRYLLSEPMTSMLNKYWFESKMHILHTFIQILIAHGNILSAYLHISLIMIMNSNRNNHDIRKYYKWMKIMIILYPIYRCGILSHINHFNNVIRSYLIYQNV